MTHRFPSFRHASAGLALLWAASLATPAIAEPIKIIDATGRTVQLDKPAERVLLGEGRLIYAVALIEREDPFAHIAGWAEDLIKFDPDAYRRYKAKFPGIDKPKVLGNLYNTDFSAEIPVSINADVILFPTTFEAKLKDGGTIEKLEKIGIKSIFIDFRDNPDKNLRPSVEILGKVFGHEDRAKAYLAFYDRELARVTDRVAKIPVAQRPLVFIENSAGYAPECCTTYGPYNFGRMVDVAGGRNWGSNKFPGFQGKVDPEAVFTTDFDVIIGTGANWSEAIPQTKAVLLGYEAKEDKVQERLRGLAERDGWKTMRAVKERRIYSIYHQFYTSPYNVVAIQALAKFMAPQLFEDLDPDATMRKLHDEFLPISASGLFWAQLK